MYQRAVGTSSVRAVSRSVAEDGRASATQLPGCIPARRHWSKRTMDFTVAAVLLLLLLPSLIAIAIAVRLSSPGPILFRQQRIGRAGTRFTLLKFRTMYVNTSSALHQDYYRTLVAGTAASVGSTFKLKNDPRVTPVGRVLRHFSLDELPQFINVLLGDMSLVGPRPPLPYEVELYGPRERRRLSVPPGLTGLWQVSGRATLNFQQMIDLDLDYIDTWSLWSDVKILARTPLVVVKGTGAC